MKSPLSHLLRGLFLFSKKRSVLTLVLMGVSAAVEGVGLLMLIPLLYIVGIGGEAEGPQILPELMAKLNVELTLEAVLIIYVGLIALHSLIFYLRDVQLSALQNGFLAKLRIDLFRAIGMAAWGYLSRVRMSDFSHSLMTDLGRTQIVVSSMLQLGSTLVTVTATIVVAVYLSPWLSVITLMLGGGFFLATRGVALKAQRLGEKQTSVTKRLIADVSEFLGGLKLAKSANAEGRLTARFANTALQVSQNSIRYSRQQAVVTGLVRTGAAIVLAVFAFVALQVIEVDAARILALSVIFARLFPVMLHLQQTWQRIAHSMPAYSSYLTMLNACESAAEPVGLGRSPEFKECLQLSGVSYRHPESEELALDAITLTIPTKCTLAIIGASGAGKSTLLDLLGGLLTPAEGDLMVDGEAVVDASAWRDSVAYVPQDTFLFNASLRENCQWVAPGASDEDIWNALSLAAASFARDLPQGLDTVLGERGIRLSGGERQRIAIAQALLRKPKLLLLDEATSALDDGNQALVQSALVNMRGQVTIVLVAHRLSTVECADKVVVLDKGTIVQQGTYQNVMGNGAAKNVALES